MTRQHLQECLDAWVRDIRAQEDLPAFAAALLYDGNVMVSADGARKAGHPAQVTAGDKFHFGSNSKAVTAAIIHQLVDEGLLRADATLAALFPELDVHPGYGNVTVTQLLTHTGGVPGDHDGLQELIAANDGMTATQLGAEIARLRLAEGPVAAGSGVFEYSNQGYVLLGVIAERATGMAFDDLARQRIFVPLDMPSAGFGPPAQAFETEPGQPWGHYRSDKDAAMPVNLDNHAVFGPAGTMHGSVGDWMKFLKYFMENIPEGTRAATPAGNGAVYTEDAFLLLPGGVLTHDGSNTMNYSRAILFPKEGVAVMLAANDGSAHARAACDELVKRLKEKWDALETGAPQKREPGNPRPFNK